MVTKSSEARAAIAKARAEVEALRRCNESVDVNVCSRFLDDCEAVVARLSMLEDVSALWTGACNVVRSHAGKYIEPGQSIFDGVPKMAARIAELEAELAERPVVESDAAMELHGFLLAHPEYRWDLIRSWRHGNVLVDLILRFIASAPPASLPVREIVVESEAARKLRERLRSPFALPFVSPTDWATLDYKRTAEILRAFRDSVPPASAPSEDERDTKRLVLLAEYQERAMQAEAELAALKAAPARVEREVDAELRDALRSSASWEQPSERVLAALDRWLAAPMSPAPAQDEYTKAAVEYAEARIVLDQNKISFYDATCDKAFQSYRALYAAGKRGEASAFRSRPPPADALAPFPDGPAVPPMAVCGGTNFNPPAPADERVTLYIPEFRRGMSGLVYSSSERSRVVDVQRWLAIDARVVREGGAA